MNLSEVINQRDFYKLSKEYWPELLKKIIAKAAKQMTTELGRFQANKNTDQNTYKTVT